MAERCGLAFVAALAMIVGYVGLLATAEPGIQLVESCFGVMCLLGFACAALAMWPR